MANTPEYYYEAESEVRQVQEPGGGRERFGDLIEIEIEIEIGAGAGQAAKSGQERTMLAPSDCESGTVPDLEPAKLNGGRVDSLGPAACLQVRLLSPSVESEGDCHYSGGQSLPI